MAAHPQLSSEGIILSLSQQEAKLDKAGIPSFVISSCDDCGGSVGSMFCTHIHTWLATQCWAITLTTELLLGVPCFSWSAGFPQPLDQTFSRSCDSDGNIIGVIVIVDGVNCGRITCGMHGFHGCRQPHIPGLL